MCNAGFNLFIHARNSDFSHDVPFQTANDSRNQSA